MQVAGENLSFPAVVKVCLLLPSDLTMILEDLRPSWAGHGVADALWSCA